MTLIMGMLFQAIIKYLTVHRDVLIVTFLFGLFGTLISSYGIIKDQKILIIIGPIIAAAAKILFVGVLFIPKFYGYVKRKINHQVIDKS